MHKKINSSLTELHLSDNDIGPDRDITLEDALKIYSSLIDGTSEEQANKISDQLLNSLKNGCLDLSDCQISDEILQDILPLLSILNITSLDLSSNDIGPAGATSLAKTLETNTSITELYFLDNNIENTGAKSIAEALKINTSIKKLDLYGNDLGPTGTLALAVALKTNTSIEELHLGDNNIENIGATALADALKINRSIKELLL